MPSLLGRILFTICAITIHILIPTHHSFFLLHLLFILPVPTYPAQRHVLIFAPNHLSVSTRCCSESETRTMVAQFAYRLQLLHLLSLRDQLSDAPEWRPHTRRVQSSHDHYFAFVGNSLTECGYLHTSRYQIVLHLQRTSLHQCRSHRNVDNCFPSHSAYGYPLLASFV